MKKAIIGLMSLIFLSACASAPNSMQKRELEVYKQQGLMVEEKSPTIGVVLGFLPGGGSFYVREYGCGVIDLLLWPVSILWDPISGANGANSINYTATKIHVNQLKQKELDELQERLRLSEIDVKQYSIEKDDIERKYSGDL
ncbi:MAG: hypothetical protein LBC30_02175 [Puniceicoccales bacterium]|jgi:hypothetical protein|nr:hypothetical protein [Puniceicoccales bacterium]